MNMNANMHIDMHTRRYITKYNRQQHGLKTSPLNPCQCYCQKPVLQPIGRPAVKASLSALKASLSGQISVLVWWYPRRSRGRLADDVMSGQPTWDDVTNGIDAWHLGPEVIVHLYLATLVGADANVVKP